MCTVKTAYITWPWRASWQPNTQGFLWIPRSVHCSDFQHSVRNIKMLITWWTLETIVSCYTIKSSVVLQVPSVTKWRPAKDLQNNGTSPSRLPSASLTEGDVIITAVWNCLLIHLHAEEITFLRIGIYFEDLNEMCWCNSDILCGYVLHCTSLNT